MPQPILTIVSQENAVELILTDESVTMKLSESLLEEVRGEMRGEPELQQNGFAGKFARFVTSAVDKMISHTIEYPLADIAAVDYVDGTLVFAYHKKRMLSFDAISVNAGKNGKDRISVLQTFAEADARAFVSRFREVKAGAL